ncbi:L28 family ribosomal protein [Deinococcus hopiensis]|uniref:LSU ribosomal protein L28P n=1 Tax=Deinococcus hopiensis KR-140 TaxID=695939 RepID=A0A1W1VD05_9DEIO|nr:L28 family ribosomal protein [Deinococcus hopiensis]SMB91262.1 LSU ribosomal protein L28P [Deinococcus hopiensis KR-140]
MNRERFPTGKKNTAVNSVTRRGKARAAGGVGRKATGTVKRMHKANLHKWGIRENGVVKQVWLSVHTLRTLARGPVRGTELA